MVEDFGSGFGSLMVLPLGDCSDNSMESSFAIILLSVAISS